MVSAITETWQLRGFDWWPGENVLPVKKNVWSNPEIPAGWRTTGHSRRTCCCKTAKCTCSTPPRKNTRALSRGRSGTSPYTELFSAIRTCRKLPLFRARRRGIEMWWNFWFRTISKLLHTTLAKNIKFFWSCSKMTLGTARNFLQSPKILGLNWYP